MYQTKHLLRGLAIFAFLFFFYFVAELQCHPVKTALTSTSSSPSLSAMARS